MRMLSPLTLIACLTFCGASVAPAQNVPLLINYQGQLSNPSGAPLATADYTLSFSIYDSATNNNQPVWGPQIFDGTAGQGHGAQVPVVRGYFNVILGPWDTNGASLANAFIATNRFVQITVGTNLPILPRQAVLSVPFALQAANSAALAGTNWAALFGTNDPVNGQLLGSRIANGTITTAQIATGGIQGSNIADGTITSNQIAAGGIQTSNLTDGAITQSKLAARPVGASVGVGGLAVSPVATELGNYYASYTFTVTLTVSGSGRPVFIILNGSQIYGSEYPQFTVTRDGTNTVSTAIMLNGNWFPPSVFSAIDTNPPSGPHTYSGVLSPTSSGYLSFSGVYMLAFEL